MKQKKIRNHPLHDNYVIPPLGKLSPDNFGWTRTPDNFGGDNFGRTGPADNSPLPDNFPTGNLHGKHRTASAEQDPRTTPPSRPDNFPGGGGYDTKRVIFFLEFKIYGRGKK